jgi:GNAT superfamily N-acetyltransferase
MSMLQFDVVPPYHIMSHPKKETAYEVFRAAFGMSLPTDTYFTPVADRHIVIASLPSQSERAVGLAVLDLTTDKEFGSPDSDKRAYLVRVAMEPALQGRKFGRQLITHCEQLALAHGFEEIALEPATETATDIYHHLGYVATPELQDEMIKSLVPERVYQV